MKAGYQVADFSDITVTLSSANGSVTVSNIDPVIVEKLKDMKKPVMVHNLKIDADGSTVEASGFTAHTLFGGVHTHTINNVAISPIGDSQIQFTFGTV